MEEKQKDLARLKEALSILLPVMIPVLIASFIASEIYSASFWYYFLNLYGFIMILASLFNLLFLLVKYLR